MHKKIKIKNVSILINNLCNMTCSHCVGLSAFNFLGQSNISESKKKYKRWSEILDFESISVAGGEPYLNPELELWFNNFREWWPEAKIEIYTNGTRLSKNIETSRKFLRDGNAQIIVSCHDLLTFNTMERDILKILEPWEDLISIEEKIEKDFPWKIFEYKIEEKVLIVFRQVVDMILPYYKSVDNGIVYFEMGGDIEKSHNLCVWNDSYTFQHGFLYKCPPVVNYSDAKLQVKFEKSAAEILEKYKGCDPFDDTDVVLNFINDLKNPIPVCALCAYDKRTKQKLEFVPITLNPEYKKRFKKNNSID